MPQGSVRVRRCSCCSRWERPASLAAATASGERRLRWIASHQRLYRVGAASRAIRVAANNNGRATGPIFSVRSSPPERKRFKALRRHRGKFRLASAPVYIEPADVPARIAKKIPCRTVVMGERVVSEPQDLSFTEVLRVSIERLPNTIRAPARKWTKPPLNSLYGPFGHLSEFPLGSPSRGSSPGCNGTSLTLEGSKTY